MAEKKMTRADAIQFAIDYLADGIDNEILKEDDQTNEVLATLKKMHEQLTKPRKKSDTKSKARILNESLADKCVAAMEGHEAVTSKWLQEHVNGLLTPQKTTAVMKIAVEDGRVVKAKDGKTVTYSLAE